MSQFNEITDSLQLLTILQDLYSNNKNNPKKINFNTHVVALDQLNSIPIDENLIVIINFATLRSGSEGTHWTCIINYEKLDKICYYDSYGVGDPPKQVLKFMKNIKDKMKNDYNINKDLVANTTENQPVKGLGSNACGWFVLYFLYRVIENNEPLYIAVNNIKTKNVLMYAKKLTKIYLSLNKNVKVIKKYKRENDKPIYGYDK